MATYYSQQLLAGATSKSATANNSASAFLLYPAVSGNNGNVEISYNTGDLGTPATSASSAIDITTSWGDVVQTLVYNNGSLQAAATAAISGSGFTGGVSAVTLTADGFGYQAAPSVTISAPQSGTNTATAVAAINTLTGAVTGVTITNPGSGYASATVTISAPPPATVTFAITSLINRQSDLVVITYNASKVATGVTVTNIGVGGVWTREDARKRLLGYI